MKSRNSRSSGRRSERGDRGSRRSSRSREDHRPTPPAKKSLWQKLLAFFRPAKKAVKQGATSRANARPEKPAAPARKPEPVEVSSPKLYVGNLSFDATESDLFELFKGVGAVRNAEIVTHRETDRSKGFGFVLMTTLEEAKRAVAELHDREFLGRKLVVSGAKSSEREANYRG
jgi:RNA recognition motif-containing protein